MINQSFDKYLISLAYTIRIVLFFNFNSSFLFWFWLEVNIVLFVVLIRLDKSVLNERDLFSQRLYYFVIQSLSSVFILIFFSIESFILKDYFLLFILVLKLGIIPLHFWVYKVSEYLRLKILFFILNIQKIPLLIFISTYRIKMVILVVIINIILGSLFLFFRSSFTEFVVSSRICFFNWIFLVFIWRMLGFFLFFAKYLFFNFILLNLKKFCNHNDYTIFKSIKVLFILTFLIGLPPFFYFFAKFYILSLLLKFRSIFVLAVSWLFSFSCLVSYFNFFSYLIFSSNSLYNRVQYFEKKDLIIVIILLLSIIIFV